MDAALQKVGLSLAEVSGRFPHELSGGQLQRVAIARALIPNPPLLITDEPVSMVDASLRMAIVNLLKALRDDFGVSVIYITHDLATAYYISDRIIIMQKGKVVEMGPARVVLDHPEHPYSKLLKASVLDAADAGAGKLGAAADLMAESELLIGKASLLTLAHRRPPGPHLQRLSERDTLRQEANGKRTGTGAPTGSRSRYFLSYLRRAVSPGDIGAVQRDHRDRHLPRAQLHLPRMREIDQRVVRLVVDPRHPEALPDQRTLRPEDVLARLVEIDVADDDRPGGLAVDGRVRGILEPVPLLQPVDERAVEVGHMADNALHIRIGHRLDRDIVPRPVDADLADLVRPVARRKGHKHSRRYGSPGKTLQHRSAFHDRSHRREVMWCVTRA